MEVLGLVLALPLKSWLVIVRPWEFNMLFGSRMRKLRAIFNF